MNRMIPAQTHLPLNAAEATALAEAIFRRSAGKPLDDAARADIAARAPKLATIHPYFGSLSAATQVSLIVRSRLKPPKARMPWGMRALKLTSTPL